MSMIYLYGSAAEAYDDIKDSYHGASDALTAGDVIVVPSEKVVGLVAEVDGEWLPIAIQYDGGTPPGHFLRVRSLDPDLMASGHYTDALAMALRVSLARM